MSDKDIMNFLPSIENPTKVFEGFLIDKKTRNITHQNKL